MDKPFLAKNIVLYYHIYREFLWENNLDNDSNGITVDELIDYVDNQIDVDDRLRLADLV